MRKSLLTYINICLLFILPGVWNTAGAQIIEIKSITCFGDSTGQLGIFPTFGTAPYTYLWDNGQTTSTIDGLKSGNYSVTVTDNNAVVQVFAYTLNDPPALATGIVITDNNSWPINTGSLLINATGGSGWYTYWVWDSLAHQVKNQTDPLFPGLASGTYYVTTEDMYGCHKHDTVYILENAALPVVTTIDTTACWRSTAPTSVEPDITGVLPIVVNFDNIQIDTVVEIIAGALPYVMSNGVDTLPSIGYAAPPGFHLVTVSTADGNGFRYSWEVDSVVAPVTITWTQQNILCFGSNTGTFTALAQGSYNGYTYSVTGPNAFAANSNSAAALFAGEYTLTATDYTGCAISQTIQITQPDEPLRIVFDAVKNARCPYSGDGGITIHRVDGATNPLVYLWSTGNPTNNIDSLFPGTYGITVTDANGCTTQDSMVVKADNKSCIYNIVTPNGDGFNDYFDLSDLCVGMTMQADIFNEKNEKVASLDENNPRWDCSDEAKPPTGSSSTYTAFIQVYKNNQPFMKWAESFSVIYSK